MAAIEAIVFATAAGFAVIVVATILVIIGVHQEERRQTLLFGEPGTAAALLARRILGAYIHLRPPPQAVESEDEEPPWLDHPVGPVGPRAR